ncbi:unnamed protein product [Eruca vesicaria subsp. sativa]|uniref:Uncharacterized protein n=1 Tax=Eruca vesicaria subsp. sativa TaxID=29727 RepID=A0ABC8LD56_ERUVS|nr:unnamed protein product [Eruca vesicaria subsp. sativa]
MEGKEKEEAKKRIMMLNKIKLKETAQEISQEDVKRQEAYNMSPRARGGGGPAGMVKSASVRQSCLCAPTTHPGSFRCRYHRRNAGLGMTRGISVPSNLSMLAGGGGGSDSTSGSPKS